MIQTEISVVIVDFAMVLATLGSAHAYDTREADKPTDLRIYLTLRTRPIHNNFTRYLTFENLVDRETSVAVAFMRSSRLMYEGHVTADGLATLQTLADHNKRSYWDIMYFENHGGSTSLDIESFTVKIDYDNSVSGKEPTATIAYTLKKELDSGDDSFRVPSRRGCRVYARDYFGWSLSEYYALPPALQLFVSDIGKSGSSDADRSESVDNPKYSSDLEHPLCSETVSWYYYETGVEIDTGTGEPHDGYQQGQPQQNYQGGHTLPLPPCEIHTQEKTVSESQHRAVASSPPTHKKCAIMVGTYSVKGRCPMEDQERNSFEPYDAHHRCQALSKQRRKQCGRAASVGPGNGLAQQRD